MRRYFYVTLFLAVGTLNGVYAQWFFESGVNDAKFTEYTNTGAATKPTTIHSYSGMRDFSYGFGYTFPLKSLDKRSMEDAKPSVLNIGLGLGFDQMNLRINSDFDGGAQVPLHYSFGQLLGRLGVSVTPTLVKKKNPDVLGIRRPAVVLNLEGGLSYNLFSYATRMHVTNNGSISNLLDNNQFVADYPAYTFGAGLTFPLNRHTRLYGKYVIENAFGTDEETSQLADGETTRVVERFSISKQRILVGLQIDFRLKNRLKANQEKRMAAVEAQQLANQDSIAAIRSIYADKIAELESALKSHEHAVDSISNAPQLFEVEHHKNGFMYLPKKS